MGRSTHRLRHRLRARRGPLRTKALDRHRRRHTRNNEKVRIRTFLILQEPYMTTVVTARKRLRLDVNVVLQKKIAPELPSFPSYSQRPEGASIFLLAVRAERARQ